MSVLGPLAHFLCALVASSNAWPSGAVSSLNDCACLRSFRPVCGTDQQTYDNICFLHCAKQSDSELRLAYDGVCCPRAELCTNYEDTVCDQFGVSYDNDCVFEFYKCIRRRQIGDELLRIVGRGEQMCGGGTRRVTAAAATGTAPSPSFKITARPNSTTNAPLSSCDFPCDNVAAPVCDSQGQTHMNRCKFDKTICRLHFRGIVSALRVVMNGACRTDDQQQQKGQSSSTTDGDQQHWDDVLNKGSKMMRTSERTESADQPNTDQQHFAQSRSQNWTLFARPIVSMEEKVPNVSACDFCGGEGTFTRNVSLCDNTNLTHQSLCSFARWNCDRRAHGMDEHILVHLGECNLASPLFTLTDEKCPSKCPRRFQSVCDSDGISHPNFCAYQMHSCLQRKSVWGRPFGWLLSMRECPKDGTTSIVPSLPTDKGMDRDQEKNTSSSSAEIAVSDDDRRHSASRKSIECPEEPMCEGTVDQQEEEERPICDSDGHLHKNICMFAHAHCLAAKDGHLLRIVPTEQCENPTKLVQEMSNKTVGDDECGRKWALCERQTAQHLDQAEKDANVSYCGTDFVTYRTLCDFQLAQCLSRNKLDLLFNASCELCLASACHPTNRSSISADGDDSHFVCDQNGETLSRCEFDMLRCVVQINLGQNVTFAHEGKCCPSESHCPPPKKPHNSLNDVCDSNGKRHLSRCLFEVTKCRVEKVERQAKALEERYCPLDELGRGGGETKWEEEEEGGEEREEEVGESGKWAAVGRGKGGEEKEQMGGGSAGGGGGGGWAQQKGVANEESNEKGSPSSESGTDQSSELVIRSAMNVSADLLSVDHLICNDKYEPVCGSDRRTYRNVCHLERRNATGTLTATRPQLPPAALVEPLRSTSTGVGGDNDDNGWAPLKVLYPGECCPTVDCPAEYAPICDSEGRTHLNLCEFGYQRCLAERMRSRNVTIAFYGLCPDSHCPRGPCPALFAPVCATNGQTYLSLCELDKTICVLKSGGRGAGAGAMIARNGVEMGDGVAIGEKASLGLDYIGECCESSVDCSDLAVASMIPLRPLCDNRGVTHSHECAFRKAKCRAKRRREPFPLRVIQNGKCERRRR